MVFQCIYIHQVPWEVLKTSAGLGFQHLPRNLANFMHEKTCLIRIVLNNNLYNSIYSSVFPLMTALRYLRFLVGCFLLLTLASLALKNSDVHVGDRCATSDVDCATSVVLDLGLQRPVVGLQMV